MPNSLARKQNGALTEKQPVFAGSSSRFQTGVGEEERESVINFRSLLSVRAPCGQKQLKEGPETKNSSSQPADSARSKRGVDSIFTEKSAGDWPRQKQPFRRQHFLNRRPLPHGHRSFRPSFSSSCLSPWTMRMPRPTCISEGKPLRRLLIGSKKRGDRQSRNRSWNSAWHTSSFSF